MEMEKLKMVDLYIVSHYLALSSTVRLGIFKME